MEESERLVPGATPEVPSPTPLPSSRGKESKRGRLLSAISGLSSGISPRPRITSPRSRVPRGTQKKQRLRANFEAPKTVERLSQVYTDKEIMDPEFLRTEAAKTGVVATADNLVNALTTHWHFKELVARLRRKEDVHPMEFTLVRGDLPVYKHHPLRGCLLHWAVWQVGLRETEGAKDLRLILKADAPIDAVATYPRFNRKTKQTEQVCLQAIHLAAGWGSTAAMQTLFDATPTDERTALVNSYCMKDGEKYYAPLHDAAFCGQKEAVVWLLENGADPTAQNIENFTPLHWLAFTGLEPHHDLEVVVRALIKYQARLDEKTRANNSLGIQGVPMEIAAMPASSYPNFLMYLLAPSFSSFKSNGTSRDLKRWPSTVLHLRHRSVFEDLGLLCQRNHQAAVAFADEIVGASAAELRNKVMYDAQLPKTADHLAAVFRAVPEAAGKIFSMLVTDPHITSKWHHPLVTRADLRRGLYEYDMICDYQTDVMSNREERHKDCLPVLPVWDCVTADHYPSWHDSFLRAPKNKSGSEVMTRVVVMPNVLALDLLMSFAEVPDEHLKVLGDVPVEGTVNCCWQSLVLPSYYVLTLMHFIDWLVLFAWGWATNDEETSQLSLGFDYAFDRDSKTNSPLSRPVFWTLICAGLMRDVCNTMWYAFQGMQFRRRILKESNERIPFGKQIGHMVVEAVFWVLRIAFLAETWTLEDRYMDAHTQAMLAAVFLAHCADLLVLIRLNSASGKRILSIMRTLLSRSMVEMLLVLSMVFMSILTALAMVHRSESAIWVATLAFVGLAFGEGDALSEFGLHPDEHSTTPYLEIWIVFVGGIVVNILLLNLLIALFANEYAQVEKVSDWHFNRERARACCWCLLALQKVRLHEGGGRLRPLLPTFAVGLGTVTGIILQALVPTAKHVYPRFMLCWISATCFAIAQVALLAQLLLSKWFVEHTDGKVGPTTDHFLWICNKSEYEEHQAHVHQDFQHLEARMKEVVRHEIEQALQGHPRHSKHEDTATADALLENNAKIDALMRHLGIAEIEEAPKRNSRGGRRRRSSRRSSSDEEVVTSTKAKPSAALRNIYNAANKFKEGNGRPREAASDPDSPPPEAKPPPQPPKVEKETTKNMVATVSLPVAALLKPALQTDGDTRTPSGSDVPRRVAPAGGRTSPKIVGISSDKWSRSPRTSPMPVSPRTPMPVSPRPPPMSISPSLTTSTKPSAKAIKIKRPKELKDSV